MAAIVQLGLISLYLYLRVLLWNHQLLHTAGSSKLAGCVLLSLRTRRKRTK